MLISLSSCFLYAQSLVKRPVSALPIIGICPGLSIHFRSPEPIRYVDISSKSITGDLPLKNLVRIKINNDSVLRFSQLSPSLGIVTIVGQTFMAQYRLQGTSVPFSEQNSADIEILPDAMVAINPQKYTISTPELTSHAMDMLKNRKIKPIIKTNALGITAKLNQVFSLGELIFLDLSFENSTLINYDIDELKFSIEDKKIQRATNQQSFDIPLVWSLYAPEGFKKTFRNIYVIDKLSFDRAKLLKVTMSEKQLSARTVTLNINYGDLLGADTF